MSDSRRKTRPSTPNPKKKHIHEFNDEERKRFVEKRVKKDAKNKKSVTFSWIDLVRFFGVRATFRISDALGGKRFYLPTRVYREPNRSSDQGFESRWMRMDENQLEELVGEDIARLFYDHFAHTYIHILPANQVEVGGYIFLFAQNRTRTMGRVKRIREALERGEAKMDIAERLGITLQQLSYYIKTYQ